MLAGVYGDQERGKFLNRNDRHVTGLHGRKRAAKVSRRIAGAYAAAYAVSENLTAKRSHPMRHLMSATGFDFSKHLKKLWWLDLVDGAVSKIGENVVFESASGVCPMLFSPMPKHLLNEFERNKP